jgi:cell division protein FtsX
MKIITTCAIALGLAGLTACNNTAREQKADNIEANAEMTADNLEEAADNATTGAGEDALENKAEAVRNVGDAKADDVRTNDPDTNLANGM